METVDFERKVDIFYSKLGYVEDETLVLGKPVITKKKSNYIWHDVDSFLGKIDRDEKHFANFLAKQTGGIVCIDDGNLTFNVNITLDKAIKFMQLYIEDFVKCQECNKCFTSMTKEEKHHKIVCRKCRAYRYI